MITVKHTSTTGEIICPGKNIIEVYYTINPSLAFCPEDGEKLEFSELIQVTVDDNYNNLAQAHAASSPFYNHPVNAPAECEDCADVGYYMDRFEYEFGGRDTYYYAKNCEVTEQECSALEQVSIRGNISSSSLCNGTGPLYSVYLDSNYSGLQNTIYTTNHLWENQQGSITAQIPNQYYATPESSGPPSGQIRTWEDDFNGNGGTFGLIQQCDPGNGDPLYYSILLRHALGTKTICAGDTDEFYLLDGTSFTSGTVLYSDMNGTVAPPSHYVTALTPPSGSAVLQIIFGSNGTLSNTGTFCGVPDNFE